ncbi:hypothetical protein H4219_005102 [Mycoemilia scoparia]|uniref:Uncharacterized protein n=1 Tax=Mycoemilia scoparia TaxID=417184 RepID=A0A9W7ZU69_9FUNG|nr:hypothetical protein H4219_005102 [Mycoemilia scoparia]
MSTSSNIPSPSPHCSHVPARVKNKQLYLQPSKSEPTIRSFQVDKRKPHIKRNLSSIEEPCFNALHPSGPGVGTNFVAPGFAANRDKRNAAILGNKVRLPRQSTIEKIDEKYKNSVSKETPVAQSTQNSSMVNNRHEHLEFFDDARAQIYKAILYYDDLKHSETPQDSAFAGPTPVSSVSTPQKLARSPKYHNFSSFSKSYTDDSQVNKG